MKASLGGATERAGIEILSRVKGHPRFIGKTPMPIAAGDLKVNPDRDLRRVAVQVG